VPVPLLDRDRRGDRRRRRKAARRPGQAPLTRPAWRERYDRPLGATFFDRSTTTVARELIGAYLLAPLGRGYRVARIVETEAYVARDSASHAVRGRTERNASMFEGPGTLYVFRIHQVECANAVTRKGEAILLRAADPLEGTNESLSGPGRLARGLGITSADDGSSLVTGRLRIVPRDELPPRTTATPRVGISRATKRRLRYAWYGHPAVSSPRPWARRAA
jgi:DNA-3-methyladenine glycosylase